LLTHSTVRKKDGQDLNGGQMTRHWSTFQGEVTPLVHILHSNHKAAITFKNSKALLSKQSASP